MAVFQGPTTENRVAKICARFLKHKDIRDMGEHEITNDDLIDQIEQIQLELSEDYLAIPGSVDLDLIIGQSEYPVPTGIFKIRDYTKPTTWTDRLNFVFDSNAWSKINDDIDELTDLQPVFAYIWNDVIRFAPTPVAADSIHLDVYYHPSTEVVYLGNLEVDSSFDEAIVNELLFRYTGKPMYHDLYLTKAEGQAQQKVRPVVGYPTTVQSSSDRLGF